MHELKIARAIIGMMQEECTSRKLDEVKTAVIEVGEFTSYKKEPIQYYFDLLKKENHAFKETTLEVIEKKGKIHCKSCNAKEAINEIMLLCKKCGSNNVDIIEGNDIKLLSLLVEDVLQ
jgi:hydrogenase nickel incorporation protein HypA/HybF